MKDATATMGDLLPDDTGGRDAVHVAVISCVAASNLDAGQHVGIYGTSPNGEKMAAGAAFLAANLFIGIVDPFLTGRVLEGQRFWLFLYPRTITSLKHQWTHPAFEAEAGVYAPPSHKLISEQWLRDFAEEKGLPSYEEMMGLVVSWLQESQFDPDPDRTLVFRNADAHADIPPEFWLHVENATGRKVGEKRPNYFSCSC